MKMNDIDFDITRKVKQGRRANQTFSPSSSIDLDSENITDIKTDVMTRAKKTGGWADDTLKSGKNKNTINLIEQQRFQEHKIDLDDDIPVIPDIEEIQDDDVSADIAQAPPIAVNSVTAYKELDSDLLQNKTRRRLGDIDLSFLTRNMFSEKDIKEVDETWTMESLFNELITTSRGHVYK